MKTQTYAGLVDIAAALVDEHNDQNLSSGLDGIEDWNEIATQAELHGLSVMLGRLSAGGSIELPRELDLQLKALTLRHQKVLAARRIVLADIIDIFNENHIQFAFLKGAALANLIYDPAWLRPMRDIDILVKRDQAYQAQTLLREVGFQNEDHKPGYLFEHHHLPNSIRIQNNFTISVEIHHDALSGDVEASINLGNLNDALQCFEFENRQAYAFGHIDMLNHLCHHTFEPADIIKLGSIVDLVRYATHFSDAIDWRMLSDSHPHIVNALYCIHCLIPLPDALSENLPGKVEDSWKPGQPGKGFLPLTQISRLPAKKEKFLALFVPSDWWMHIFYAIPPGQSLLTTRLIRHPLTISKWLLRRYKAAGKSKIPFFRNSTLRLKQ